MSRPTPAPARFPYAERRTMAQVIEAEAQQIKALHLAREVYGADHPYIRVIERELGAVA